ncbi:MAG: hypothetical protein FVQ77_16070 [Cytophagales bacterium]|nr:hypothetical protein [Cytophagales bacterium]
MKQQKNIYGKTILLLRNIVIPGEARELPAINTFASKTLLIGVIFSLICEIGVSQNVGINQPNPDSSALLDLTATDMGLLIPRVALTGTTDITTIASAATSLMVYNTAAVSDVTPGYYYWDGAVWQRLQNSLPTPSNDWTIIGNAVTDPATNFIGTTDAQNFAIRTNDLKRLEVTQTGRLDFFNTSGGGSNIFVEGGNETTTGGSNVAIGDSALLANTTGARNVALGFNTLKANTIGIDNVALGGDALFLNTTGSNNIGVGVNAAHDNTTGTGNIAIGESALFKNQTSSGSIAIGAYAKYNAAVTSSNGSHIAIGDSALFTSPGFGSAQNIAVGKNALKLTTTSNNTAFGDNVLANTTTGSGNVGIGYGSLFTNTIGTHNIGIGHAALFANTTGSDNIAIGAGFTLSNNTTGSRNTGVGLTSLWNNTIGDDNIGIGQNSLQSNTTGSRNVAVGIKSLAISTTGNSNVAVGYSALLRNETGSNNVAIGDSALIRNTIGNSNIAIGHNALIANTGGGANIAIGLNALTANTTGIWNTAVGLNALRDNTIGNVNTAIGINALLANTTGSNNTALGVGAYITGTTFTNSTALGAGANITASDQIRIGNGTVTSIGGFSAWSNLSDARFKDNVQENIPGLAFILKLRPISYQLNLDKLASYLNTPDSLRNIKEEQLRIQDINTGFLAQEVEKAAKELGFYFSGVDKPKNDGDYYGLRYAAFVVPLVKAAQEQQEMIEQLQKEIIELKRK